MSFPAVASANADSSKTKLAKDDSIQLTFSDMNLIRSFEDSTTVKEPGLEPGESEVLRPIVTEATEPDVVDIALGSNARDGQATGHLWVMCT